MEKISKYEAITTALNAAGTVFAAFETLLILLPVLLLAIFGNIGYMAIIAAIVLAVTVQFLIINKSKKCRLWLRLLLFFVCVAEIAACTAIVGSCTLIWVSVRYTLFVREIKFDAEYWACMFLAVLTFLACVVMLAKLVINFIFLIRGKRWREDYEN